MTDRKQVDSISVRVDGRDITLSRSEIVKDEKIAVLLNDFEKLRAEIEHNEYERQKLSYAHMAMQAQLGKLCNGYAQQTYGVRDEKTKDVNKDESDE